MDIRTLRCAALRVSPFLLSALLLYGQTICFIALVYINVCCGGSYLLFFGI